MLGDGMFSEWCHNTPRRVASPQHWTLGPASLEERNSHGRDHERGVCVCVCVCVCVNCLMLMQLIPQPIWDARSWKCLGIRYTCCCNMHDFREKRVLLHRCMRHCHIATAGLVLMGPAVFSESLAATPYRPPKFVVSECRLGNTSTGVRSKTIARWVPGWVLRLNHVENAHRTVSWCGGSWRDSGGCRQSTFHSPNPWEYGQGLTDPMFVWCVGLRFLGTSLHKNTVGLNELWIRRSHLKLRCWGVSVLPAIQDWLWFGPAVHFALHI